MDTNKMRAEFENSPKFRGMDFTRSSTHPDYYESPYANGAWDGWKASREALVVELPETEYFGDSWSGGWAITRDNVVDALEEQGLKVAP